MTTGHARLYIAGIGAACVLPRAGASIVYQDIPDVHLVPDYSVLYGSVSRAIDLDADGLDDLTFGLSWNHVGGQQQHSTGVATSTGMATVNGRSSWMWSTTSPRALQPGYPIGPTFEYPNYGWGSGGFLRDNGEVSQGWWWGEGYMGIRLTSAEGVMYGWVHMSANAYHLDVFSFAYETTPDAPIAAGAIPAPTTLAILLSLVGLGGVRRGRRSGPLCA